MHVMIWRDAISNHQTAADTYDCGWENIPDLMKGLPARRCTAAAVFAQQTERASRADASEEPDPTSSPPELLPMSGPANRAV